MIPLLQCLHSCAQRARRNTGQGVSIHITHTHTHTQKRILTLHTYFPNVHAWYIRHIPRGKGHIQQSRYEFIDVLDGWACISEGLVSIYKHSITAFRNTAHARHTHHIPTTSQTHVPSERSGPEVGTPVLPALPLLSLMLPLLLLLLLLLMLLPLRHMVQTPRLLAVALALPLPVTLTLRSSSTSEASPATLPVAWTGASLYVCIACRNWLTNVRSMMILRCCSSAKRLLPCRISSATCSIRGLFELDNDEEICEDILALYSLRLPWWTALAVSSKTKTHRTSHAALSFGLLTTIDCMVLCRCSMNRRSQSQSLSTACYMLG
jgi:hypothetical protein